MQRKKDPIDTYLLRVLQALLTEQSVSRTAILMGQSQPAISNALRRLREITGDQILLRGQSGMVPTARGEELLLFANEALAAIERIANPPEAFDPATSEREFHIAAPDYLDAIFLPSIAQQLRRHAPHTKLIVHPIGPDTSYVKQLEEGVLDLVIANWLAPPEQLHMSRLFDDEVVCMVGTEHPLARRGIDMKCFLEMPHLAPTVYVAHRKNFIDGSLAEQGLRRNIQMSVPYFGLVPYVLIRTDLVFTTGRQFAEHYAKDLPITVLPSPFKFPPMRFYQLWHRRTHKAPEVIWLRKRVTEVANRLVRPREPLALFVASDEN